MDHHSFQFSLIQCSDSVNRHELAWSAENWASLWELGARWNLCKHEVTQAYTAAGFQNTHTTIRNEETTVSNIVIIIINYCWHLEYQVDIFFGLIRILLEDQHSWKTHLWSLCFGIVAFAFVSRFKSRFFTTACVIFLVKTARHWIEVQVHKIVVLVVYNVIILIDILYTCKYRHITTCALTRSSQE